MFENINPDTIKLEVGRYSKTITVHGENEIELQLNGVVECFLGLREVFKKTNNYNIADQIRDNLEMVGIKIHDTKDGYVWENIGIKDTEKKLVIGKA